MGRGDFQLTPARRSQDINTPLTTPSGNLHGCPVSFLMGLPGTSKEEIPEYAWIEPVLKAERLVYIGLRDIDAGERKILKENSASGVFICPASSRLERVRRQDCRGGQYAHF